MTEQTTQPSKDKFTVPMAIVVAGGFIALAVFFRPSTSSMPNENVAGTGGTEPTAAPTQVDVNPGEVTDADHIRGARDAKVTLIEYSDLECPYCRNFHPTLERVLEEYPNDVRWVYRHLPLEAIHPQARLSSNAAECAAEQGKFWEYIDYVFGNTSSGADLVKDKLITYATAAGVANVQQFTTCLDEQKYNEEVNKDMADAASAGGRGTPYTILVGPGGEKVPISGALPYESVKAQIDTLLN